MYFSEAQQIIRMAAPNTVVRNGPIVYKRIRLPDSDSDDSASPAKKPAVTVELTTQVKERRFRNMLEMFPEISPMVSIHGIFILF